MKTETLSAFLVEDEPHCRADFRQVLQDFPEIRLIGEADSLAAADRFLQKQAVDLLFLDLSVGKANGLDLAERLSPRPLIIALTAHPQYAVRGFSLDLVDYILKPVEKGRLKEALEKARYRKVSAPLQPGRITFLAELDGKKTTFDLSEILGAESMGNYVVLHTTRGNAIKRATFKTVCSKLSPELFFETGRGRVVAIRSVRAWHRSEDGRLQLELSDNSRLGVAESQTPEVLKILKKRHSL